MPAIRRPLLSRLHHDLAELLDLPYPGVAIFTDDADLRKLCLILTPPSGPWKDLSLHFDVELPDTWPTSPPKVRSSVTGIEHPNLFGEWICCDLLKEQWELEVGYTGGYTPALTLRGLFLQFLTFFSSTKVEQDHGGAIYIGDYMMINYVRHTDMARLTFAMNDGSYSRSTKQNDDQFRLEKLWKSSTSQEVVLGEHFYAGTKALHTIKETNSDTGRLHRFEWINPRWKSTYNRVSHWRCKSCPYGSPDLPVYRGTQDDEVVCNAPSHPKTHLTCLLEILNDDVLLEMAARLPSESLMSFSTAYPRLRNLVISTHLLLQRELRCFFLRSSLKDSTLGIGISLEPQSRTLSSDFDWLSKEAFDKHKIRTSIQKRPFQYFLPLAFSRPHFSRACGDIWVQLAMIDLAVQDTEKSRGLNRRSGRNLVRQPIMPPQPHQAVGIVYKMMNHIVVSLMKSCNDAFSSTSEGRQSMNTTLLHASEKAVISYCHLFHLLICLGRTTPPVLREATIRLYRFVQLPASRAKAEVPDLGELIVLITLVLTLPPIGNTPITWSMLNGPFLEEAIVRNVRWVLKDAPELEILEQGTCDYRLFKTFEKSKTGLRLIMFQITFLDIFLKTYASDISRLDDNYGFADAGIPEHMVKEFKKIYEVNFWPGFFERAQYARGIQFGKEKFSDMLRTAIRTSGKRGYHTPKTIQQLHILSSDRKRMESEWIKTRS